MSPLYKTLLYETCQLSAYYYRGHNRLLRLSGSAKEKGGLSQHIKQTKAAVADKSKRELKQKAAEAKLFTQRKGYNENICFFIDMNLASGQNRFFIYDLEKDSVQA